MELLTAAEAARYLKLSERTLCAMRARGDGPHYTHVSLNGRGIRYRTTDLEIWIAERARAYASA